MSSGIERNRSKYMLIAASCATLAGSLSFPLWYNIKISPLLNPLFTVYAVIMAYAILKHHIMDITIVIRKGLIYSILIGCVTGLYIAFLNISNYLIVGNNISLPFHIPTTAIPPLLSSMAFILLGIFVLLKGKNREVGVPFFYFCFFTFWWQFTMFLMHTFNVAVLATGIVKITYSGIIFIPIAFNQFLLNLVDYPHRRKASNTFYAIGIF